MRRSSEVGSASRGASGRLVSQEEIAEAIGVSRVWYALLESGRPVRGVDLLTRTHLRCSHVGRTTTKRPTLFRGFGRVHAYRAPYRILETSARQHLVSSRFRSRSDNLEPQVAAKAAAFQSLWQHLGGSALLVTMLAQSEALHQDALAQYASVAYVPVQRFLSDHGSLNILYSNIIREASVISFADCQRILGYLVFALLPIVFVLPKRKKEAASAHISVE